MKREGVKVPENNVRDYAHELAYKLACEQLAGIDNVEQQCLKSGAQYIPSQKAIIIEHLKQSYKISFPEGEVSFTAGGEAVPIRDKIPKPLNWRIVNERKGNFQSGLSVNR